MNNRVVDIGPVLGARGPLMGLFKNMTKYGFAESLQPVVAFATANPDICDATALQCATLQVFLENFVKESIRSST